MKTMTLFGALLLSLLVRAAVPADPVVVVGADVEPAVRIAGEEFAKYWQIVTGRALKTAEVRPAAGRAVVIGEAPKGTRWGEQDTYVLKDAGETLYLAGKNGRSTLYAVYEFFRLRANCAWFWDGDTVPKADTVGWQGLDVREESRFEYRGLRYFAHRGLTRFQAEHWGFEDWKREIDWAVKSRLNLIMLRIGQDDVFQKAFPDLVPYPDPAKPYEWGSKGFNDRSLFWSLQERGALRKKVMDYAFARGLMQPEDFGTMSHWYSRTPKDFLEKAKPDLLRQPANSNYADESGLVWDVRDDRWRDAYWKLTETSIREYGRPDLLHTIGLGERRIFTDPKKNFDLKLEVLKRMTDKASAAYPDAKILLAGWDFYSTWKSNEVQALVKTLDPKRFVIWDYEADAYEEDNNFTQWGFVGRIPYVFGTFLCYEQGLDVRANYERIERRWAVAANDPFCKGWILWPESSHTDTLFLKYFTDNAWRPDGVLENDRLRDFCRARYGKDAATMAEAWSKTLPVSQTIGWWGNYGQNMINWEQTLADGNSLDLTLLKARLAREALPLLAKADLDDPFVRRDAIDLARTILDRTLNAGRIRLWKRFADWRARQVPTALFLREIDAFERLGADMVALLGQHTDYSLADSLERLKAAAPVPNPDFDRTLLQNAANDYCRSHQYEVAAAWYQPLIAGLCDVLRTKARTGDRTEEDAKARAALCDGLGEKLMQARLADLRPTAPRTAEALRGVLADAYEATALVAAPSAGARLTFPGAPSLQEIDALAKGGADLTVVFHGCSLTWGANASDPETTSFRGRTMEALRTRYPKAHWHFVNSAIGGLDSHSGIFRIDRDVLAKHPDLVILDYTLNDHLDGSPEGRFDRKNALYEAMIRRCMAEGVAVLPVILTRKEFTAAKDIGFLKRRVQHQEIAAHYGLGCADVLGVLNADCRAGKVDLSTCWPAGMFDTCHPYDPGYAAYADAFLREWDRILGEKEKTAVLPVAWHGRSFTGLRRREAAEFVDEKKGWRLEMPYCTANTHDWLASRWMDRLLVLGNGARNDSFAYQEVKPSEPFVFSFRGGYVGMFLEIVKENVPFELVIDGVSRGVRQTEMALISFARYYLLADDLEPGRLHTVEIRPVLPATGVGVLRIGAICTAEGYGPKPDADETAAIQKSIDAAWQAGGGRVDVTPGVHYVKGLRLRSNVELHLQTNAVLMSRGACATDFDVLQRDTLEPVPAERLEAARLCQWRILFERGASYVHPIREPASHWYNAMIRLYGATNAKITGEKGSAIDGADICEPDFGECFCRGVHGITAHFTTNFVLRGVEMRRTGNWATCIHDSADLVFEDLVFRDGYDGVHVRGCDRIRVSRCDIRTGDDCVAGFDNSDVLVEDCRMTTPANGFRFGGTHVRIRRCRMWGPAESPVHGSLPQRIILDGADNAGHNRPPAGPFFAFLSDVTRNVRQEPGDIVIEDCTVDGVDRLLYYDLQEKHPWQVGSAIRDITFRNVKATNLHNPSLAVATDGHPIRIVLDNVVQSFTKPGTKPFVSASVEWKGK